MTTPRKIWQDVIASPAILKQYPKAIEKLRAGVSCPDIDLKIKSHPRVYGIRTNKKIRLLFTTITIDGKTYAYVLEALTDHNYETCSSMKEGVVEERLKSKDAEHNIAYYFSQQEKNNLSIPTTNNHNGHNQNKFYQVDYIELDYLDNKWMELNNIQKVVLTTPRPFICNGTPGSGKTTLIHLVVAKAIDDGCTEILIVTQSQQLRDEMEKTWLESPYSKDRPENISVKFITYVELLQQSYPGKLFVDDEHCIKWLKAKSVQNAETMHAEFRIACGYKEADYLNLGERQSLLLNEGGSRKESWKFFQEYLDHLKNKNCIHPAFTRLPEDKKYSMIALDEAQDFSNLQLSSLCNQAEAANICIFHDCDQSLYDRISKTEYLKSCIKELIGKYILPMELSFSYRSAAAIVRAANHVLEMRILLDGGRVNTDQKLKVEKEPSDTREGSVEWPTYSNNDDEILIKQLKERAKSIDCAIITVEGFVEKAKKLFGTELVYTVADIKGLQYKEIIIYRLFDNPDDKSFFNDVNKRLPQLFDNKINTNRPKEREIKSHPFWMNLYAAIMRAMDYVCIVQSRKGIANVAKYMTKEMSETFSKKNPVEKTSDADWQEKAKELEVKGRGDQARVIKHQVANNKKPAVNNNNKKVAEKKIIPIKNVTNAKPISKSQVSEQVSVRPTLPIVFSDKDKKFLFDVLNNFSEDNLAIFFNYHRKWELLVMACFTPPGKNEETEFLTELMENPRYSSRFFDFISRETEGGSHFILDILPDNMNDILVTIVAGAIRKMHRGYVLAMFKRKNMDFQKIRIGDMSLLQFASFHSNEEMVEVILQRQPYDINESGCLEPYKTPLYLAAASGKQNNVLSLLSAGANINGNDKNYIRTPLMIAVQSGDNSLMNLLMEKNAKLPSGFGEFDNSVFLEKCIKHADVMGFLERRLEDSKYFPLRVHVDRVKIVDCKDMNKYLQKYSEGNFIQLLGKAGALRELFDQRVLDGKKKISTLIDLILDGQPIRGKVFYDCLCKLGPKGRAIVFDMLPSDPEQQAWAEYESENSKEPRLYNASYFYNYLIGSAAALGHDQFVKLMLDNGKHDPSLKRDNISVNELGGNLLHFTIPYLGKEFNVPRRYMQTVFVQLKSNLFDINLPDSQGDTPLHLAVKMGNVFVIIMLLQAGANINGNDENYIRTPLVAAVQTKCFRAIDLLMDCGAKLPTGIDTLSDLVKKSQNNPDLIGYLEFIKNQPANHPSPMFSSNSLQEMLSAKNGLECVPLEKRKDFFDCLCSCVFELKISEANLNHLIKFAMKMPHFKFVKLMIDNRKISIDEVMQFALNENETGILYALIKNNVIDPGASLYDKLHETYLYVAASASFCDPAYLLVLAGADVAGDGWSDIRTPLMAAMQKRQYDVARMLISYGARFPVILNGFGFEEIRNRCRTVSDYMSYLESAENTAKNLHSFFKQQPNINQQSANVAKKTMRTNTRK